MVDIRHIKPMRALMLGKLVQRIHFPINDSLLSESSHHKISLRKVAYYHLLFIVLLMRFHDQVQQSVHAVV